MANFTIEPLDESYQSWAEDFIRQHWGTPWQVTRGKLHQVLEYPGFVAVVDGQPAGIITYRIEGQQCEILMLHSAVEGIGVGASLVDHVKARAQEAGCRRLWLITTNDNIRAIRWYQKRGFTIAAVHVNELEQSRKLKPEIPLIGNEGIPIRDEIEFEMILERAGTAINEAG